MSIVELDTVGPSDEDFVRFLKSNHIKMTVVDPHGPGGGFLVCSYYAERVKLEALILEWWDDDGLFKYIVD